uniref:HTH_48 domain-containing protein n=1 Tax=Anopheles dirus TaxID=7168 RepID=A0A182NWS2_9DIPT
MNTYAPTERHLRDVLIFLYNMKKTATEAHQELVEVYGEESLSLAACRKFYAQFDKGVFYESDRKSTAKQVN